MSFKSLLKQKLKSKLSEKELSLLPSGYQNLANIIILNLKPELIKYKKIIGEKVLEIFPRIKTICNKESGIKGKFRKPNIEIIAGNKNTEIIHKENNCLYKFDIKKIMFSKGNIYEKQRLASKVKKNETIIDMFAGIGYFTLPIAKLSKPEKIYSIELNPIAYKYLVENIKLNKFNNIEAIKGDASKEVKKLKEKGIKADRVVMGLLPAPKSHLPTAISILKKNGILHYEGLGENYSELLDNVKKQAEKQKRKIKLIKANKVKSYKPKIWHYTLAININ